MALTVAQRIERLRVRLEELACWRDRDYRDLDEWEFDGHHLALGQAWPATHGTVHFSHPAVTVPTGWPMAHTVLEFAPGGEGLVTIRYDDGSHDSWALDPYHRRFPVRQPRFSLAADAVARLPFGVPNRAARLEVARLVLVDSAVTHLFRRLEIVTQAAAVLVDTEVAPLLVATAERALASLDWPSATDVYLARMQGTQQMLNIWKMPVGLDRHPPGLSDSEVASVRAAAGQLKRDLKNLLPRYPKHGALALSGHAHLDLAWLWPMDETRRKAQRTFYTVIGLMERYPQFNFNQSTAQVYAFLDEDDPNLLAAIKDRVASGQWEPVGGMWVEPDTNMPSGESLVRQLLYGQRYFKRTFGATHSVGWMPDCFGFCPQLPQILRGAGIDSFFTIKLNWSETNRFPYDLFWWQALDGSRVLAHMFDNPSSPFGDPPGIGGYNGDPTPFAAVNTWANYRGKYLFPESLFTIGFGDGGGGPTSEMLERVAETNSVPTIPSMEFTTIHEFFQRAHETVRNQDVPTWTGEMYLELHRGTLTSQGRTKYLHRRAERDLVAAEALGAMVALCGGDFPESLEEQWCLVLRNEFHDILPGSSIGEVYEVANAELQSVVDRAGAASDAALAALATSLRSTGDQPALLLVNPDIAARPLRVQFDGEFPGAQPVEGGSVLAGAEKVPGLGAAIVLYPTPAESVSVSSDHLENEYLRVTITSDGTVASVWDKRTNREALAGPGNQIWAHVD
ncbi:MAG TPA: alpha-mannosidase, partial [Chloroflexota bacterium]|nr:alpha-mannosidase [Chloroflexota bacterium]